MFPDSKLAQNYRMSSTKLMYLIRFGISPYLKELIIAELTDSAFSFAFDETTTAQKKKQLDGYVSYVDPNNNNISGVYIGSRFLGHCTSQDLVKNVCGLFDDFSLSFDNLIAIGMDGPNVNQKFFRLIKAKASEEFSTGVIEKGNCTLHVANNSFKAGVKLLNFNIEEFVGDIVFFFELSTSRR